MHSVYVLVLVVDFDNDVIIKFNDFTKTANSEQYW